jgi:hypothetical protein
MGLIDFMLDNPRVFLKGAFVNPNEVTFTIISRGERKIYMNGGGRRNGPPCCTEPWSSTIKRPAL